VNPQTNIIVTGSKATPAKSISEVREVLGVRASDNLMHAHLVLVVEGDSDRVIIQALATHLSTKVANALKNNTIAVEHAHGATKLPYKLSELTACLCNVHCLLDHDDAGRAAAKTVETEGLATTADISFTTCPGMKDSEIEDTINVSTYADLILSAYGVDLSKATFRTNQKWSERMGRTFMAQGKLWSDSVARDVKAAIANRVANYSANPLITQKSKSLEALFETLERKLAMSKDR
jgi:predicted ATP-dependent endonuclease of OLD family